MALNQASPISEPAAGDSIEDEAHAHKAWINEMTRLVRDLYACNLETLVFQDGYYDLIFTLDAKSAVQLKVVNEGNKPTKWLVAKDLVKHRALCSDATSAFSQRCLDIHNRLREVAPQGLVDSSSVIFGSPGWIFPPPFAALDGLCPRPEDARLLMLSMDLPMSFKHDDLRNPLVLTANVLSTADGLESYIASHNNDVEARFAMIVREKRRQIALLRDRTKISEATNAVLASDYFFLDLRLCYESNTKHIQGRTPDLEMANKFFQGLHADLDVIERQLNAVASTISTPDSDVAIKPSLDVEPVLTSPHSADARSMGRLAQIALCFCAAAALIVTSIYAVTRTNTKLDGLLVSDSARSSRAIGTHQLATHDFDAVAASPGVPNIEAQVARTQANTELGVRYLTGKGLPKDYAAALEHFRESAKLGDARALTNLGWMLTLGQGVTRDDGKAVAAFQAAADKGYAGAQDSLGYMYEHGRGVPIDLDVAASWYRKAADQGFAKATVNLQRLSQQ